MNLDRRIFLFFFCFLCSCLSQDKSLNAPDLPNLLDTPDQVVSSKELVELRLDFKSGWMLNDSAPSYLELQKRSSSKRRYERDELIRGNTTLPQLVDGESYRLQGTLYYCQEKKKSVCVMQSFNQVLQADPRGRAWISLQPKHYP